MAWLASVWLIAIGVYGVLTSANVLRMLVSIETLFNGVIVALLLSMLARGSGTISLIVDTGILVLAAVILTAVEVAVLAAIILLLYRTKQTVGVEDLKELRG